MSEDYPLEVPLGASAFFDWASLSPLCAAAANAQLRYLEQIRTVVDAPYTMRKWTDLGFLRTLIRSFAGGDLGHDVVIGRSASEFLTTLAYGLDLQGRRGVILCEPNHPCLPIAWGSAAEIRGLRLKVVPATPSREIDVQALAKALDEDTAVVLLTHVDHLHGVVQPVQEVAALARAVGARVIVDGAQAVGRVPINIGANGVDAYIGVGRKALLSSIGTAFLVAHRGLVEDTRPLIWSTRAAALDHCGHPQVLGGPVHLEGNLPDMGALAGLEAAVTAFDNATVCALRSHVASRLEQLIAGLDGVGLQPLAPPTRDNAGIVTFRLPAHARGPQVQHNLRQAGLVIAASESECRVSLHFANERRDVQRLIEEVAKSV